MTGLILSASAVAAVIAAGFFMKGKRFKQSRALYSTILGVSSLIVFTGVILALFSAPAHAEEAAAAAGGMSAGLAFISAAAVTSIACTAAAYAVSTVGSAALGLIGEKPELLGATLIYLGLAEGIAIYGVIISLMILQKL